MIGAVVGVLSTWPAAAHHATNMFSHDQVLTITGVVKEVHWTNPHVMIHIEGAPQGKRPSTWVLEMTSPGNLARTSKWTRKSFKPGDRVMVDLAPLRDGRNGGALMRMTHADSGLSLTADLRAQEALLEK